MRLNRLRFAHGSFGPGLVVVAVKNNTWMNNHASHAMGPESLTLPIWATAQERPPIATGVPQC